MSSDEGSGRKGRFWVVAPTIAVSESVFVLFGLVFNIVHGVLWWNPAPSSGLSTYLMVAIVWSLCVAVKQDDKSCTNPYSCRRTTNPG